MNFYYIFVSLCNGKGVKPSVAAKEIGISKSNVSNWKTRGTFPTDSNLQKIADYFDVSIEYLKGKTQNPSTDNGKGDNIERFTVFAMDGKVPGARHIDVNMDTFAELNELIKEAQDLPKEKLQALIASAKAMK